MNKTAEMRLWGSGDVRVRHSSDFGIHFVVTGCYMRRNINGQSCNYAACAHVLLEK
jgi:hypothetical protein